MSYKYCCDECGADLSESDNVAIQLDLYGKAWCSKCFTKRPVSDTNLYTLTNDELKKLKKEQQ